MSQSGRKRRASLGIGYLTVFIDLLGFGIILPSLPYYAQRLGASGLWLGVLLTSYSFAQLVGAVVLGRLSDRFGRRPLILLGLAGSSISLALTAVAGSLAALAAARALAGLFGGSIAAGQAYVADVTEGEERAKFMGFLGAAIGLGFVLGPALGALLSPLGFGTAAFVASALAAANFLFALFELEESRRAGQGRRQLGWGQLRSALRRPGLRRALIAVFLTTFAFVGMETTLAYLGKVLFGLNERTFGFMLVLVGGVMVFVQAVLIGPLTERWGERRLALSGSLLMALSLLLMPLAPGFGLAVSILAVLGTGRALTQPTLSTLVSRLSPADEQGGVLGLGQSLAAMARAIGPLTAGWLYDLGRAYPYHLGVVLSLGAAGVLFGLRAPGEEPAGTTSR